jgi:hypothetical protein
MLKRFLVMGGLFGFIVSPADSGQPLTVTATPKISFAPASVRIRARIEPNASNRLLTIVADGENFYRSSEIQLDGDQAPRVFELDLRSVPAGDYDVVTILNDAKGAQRVSAPLSVTVLGAQ